jgi:hypothetical protein
MKKILFALIALAMVFGMTLPVQASSSDQHQYSVFNVVITGNESLTIGNVTYLTNPICVSGNASVTPDFQGQISQYNVLVTWRLQNDGVYSEQFAQTNFQPLPGSKGFSGNWSIPCQYYPPGNYTISIELYHSNPNQGSGDLLYTYPIPINVVIVIVKVPPSVTTNAASNVNIDSAVLNGNLTDLGSASSVYVFFEWGTTHSGPYPNKIAATPSCMTGTGTFFANLISLSPDTTYYFKALAVGYGFGYGLEGNFTTANVTEYSLYVESDGNGNITVGDLGTVPANGNETFTGIPCGTVVTVSASAEDSCWQFSGWSGDLSGNVSSQEITMDSNKSVTATFVKKSYTLSTAVVGSGNITLDPPGGTYDCGTVVTVSASTEDSCWQFSGWSGDLSGNVSSQEITMDSNKSVTATFVKKSYTLSTAVVGSGNITLDPPGGTYDCGTSVQVLATPAIGWRFDGWSGNLAGSVNPTTILMNANASITAKFSQIPPPPPPPYVVVLTSVVVTPGNATVLVGGTEQFTATANYSNGSSGIVTSSAIWASGDTSVATVSAGLATGVALGNTSITATYGGYSGSAKLNVISGQGAVVSIIVLPESASIAVGQSQQFTATATYENGSSGDITSEAIWESGNVSVSTISAGNATGVGVGTTGVTAEYGNVTSNTATLTVGPAVITGITINTGGSVEVCGTKQITAIATYSDGSSRDVTSEVTWSSSDPGKATIDATGLATGIAVGDVTITAALDGVTSSATLSVIPSGIVSIVLTPASASILVNSTQQFTAIAMYANGNSTDVTAQASWASSDENVATVVAGLAVAKASGTTDITATFCNVTSNSVTLTVSVGVPWSLIGGIIGGLLALGLLLFFLLRRRRRGAEPVETP